MDSSSNELSFNSKDWLLDEIFLGLMLGCEKTSIFGRFRMLNNDCLFSLGRTIYGLLFVQSLLKSLKPALRKAKFLSLFHILIPLDLLQIFPPECCQLPMRTVRILQHIGFQFLLNLGMHRLSPSLSFLDFFLYIPAMEVLPVDTVLSGFLLDDACYWTLFVGFGGSNLIHNEFLHLHWIVIVVSLLPTAVLFLDGPILYDWLHLSQRLTSIAIFERLSITIRGPDRESFYLQLSEGIE